MRASLRVPLTVTRTVPEPVTPTVPEPLGGTVTPAADGTIEALKAHVQTMRELLDQQAATHAAEVARLIKASTQLQDELQEARAEANHAKLIRSHGAGCCDHVRRAKGSGGSSC